MNRHRNLYTHLHNKSTKVLIAEKRDFVRAGLEKAISAEKAMNPVGSASHAMDLEKMVQIHQPDVLILALDLPGLNPQKEVLHLNEYFPAMRIILFIEDESYTQMQLTNRIKAAGYLLKSDERQRLVEVIRTVANDKQWVSPQLTTRWLSLMQSQQLPVTAPMPAFSKRQQDILALMIKGLSDQEISDQLYLSARTTRRNLQQTYRLLGVQNRVEAAVEVVRHGWF
ncbi:MAG: response regulator transcription factor [Chloroflexota bacterium]